MACLLVAPTAATGADSIELKDCDLVLDAGADVAAQEAGVLMEVPVEEGAYVQKSELLAQIDDSIAREQLKIAKNRLKVAEVEAESDIYIRYATAAAAVARAEYDLAIEANRQVEGAFPLAEVRRLLLKHNEMVLSIRKSEMDRRIAQLQVNVSKAELDATEVSVARRKILCPFDGIVMEVSKHVGEWVQPGDRIVRVIRVNCLRVESELDIEQFAPGDVAGRKVTVKVILTGERPVSFDGVLSFTGSEIDQRGRYPIRAKIQNRRENGRWLLQAGMKAEMTIHLD